MLQQTTVQTVIPYFHRFIDRWPGIEDLATAPLDDVLAAWAGLGYYARARNLHRCALVVSGQLGGQFPDSEADLRELPGIGDYTAAAVAAIAFDRKATVVDGNVERVVARLFAVETPLPKAKPELKRLADGLTPAKRPGDYAQAMMDLGATVCAVTRPKCDACPLAGLCRARAKGIAQDLPRRKPKAKRPTRRGIAFWIVEPDGAVLLQRRPESGLLGGMMGLPSTEWREDAWTKTEARTKAKNEAPMAAEWQSLPGLVRHSFTHFHLELEIWAGRAQTKILAENKRWVTLDDLDRQALPTVMKKAVAHALECDRFKFDQFET